MVQWGQTLNLNVRIVVFQGNSGEKPLNVSVITSTHIESYSTVRTIIGRLKIKLKSDRSLRLSLLSLVTGLKQPDLYEFKHFFDSDLNIFSYGAFLVVFVMGKRSNLVVVWSIVPPHNQCIVLILPMKRVVPL